MTSDAVPAGGDPRRLLADAQGLARQVRLDQRVSWVALLILATVTFVGIPFDYFGAVWNCTPDDACTVWRLGVLIYWPAALLLAYAGIALCYVRIARARGLGARVRPYALTGVGLTVLFTAAWIMASLYLRDHPRTFPAWALVFDRLITPWGTIGVALLVLARLERSIALLVYSLAYLAVVVVPVTFGWHSLGGVKAMFVPQQIITGTVLLIGGLGFTLAQQLRRPR